MAEDTPPFFDPTPPHWAANGLAYLVIAVVAIATMAAVVVQVPETLSSPFILTPCSGALLRRQIEASDAYAVEGDLPSELACAGEKLQAKLTLPESGSVRIRPGQVATLLYDAFPYGLYGVRYGTIRWAGSAVVDSQNSRNFHAFADIDDKTILVDGQPRPLRAGMRGTAKIVLGKRSLISYAFEPLRQLKESFAEPPERPAREKPS
jgi:adhesin transport system membrane fusion protein